MCIRDRIYDCTLEQAERRRVWREEQAKEEEKLRLRREQEEKEAAERRAALWKKNRPYLIAALAVLILAGAGIALCFSQGGSTGGTDIVAMIINKYRTVSYGKILIYSDFVIIGSALLVGMGISAVIYGYVMTAVVGYTVDMIMAGNQQSSQVFIVTHDYEKMAQAIVDNVHRGVTLIDSQGWYSKKESKIVMVVCRKRETSMILKFVKTIDPKSGQVKADHPDFLKTGDIAVVKLEPTKPMVIETAKEFPPLGRFAIRDMGQTVAAGMCIEVEKA